MMLQHTERSALLIRTVEAAAVERIRQLILRGELAPGQRLLQEELAERLGISRTPIREALRRLAHEGLVTISSYKGASVARFSRSDLIEAYSVRIALESYAAYLTSQKITDRELKQLEGPMNEMGEAFQNQDFERLLEAHQRLHTDIYAIAGRQRLYEHIIQYLDLTNLYQRMALSLGRGASDPIQEHMEMLEALQRRDAEGAARIVRTHLELTMAELLAVFREPVEKNSESEAK